MTRILTLDAIERLAHDALVKAGASEAQAGPVALSMRRAEADGIPLVGLSYLVGYLANLRSGKVDGRAIPVVTRPRPASVAVDAANGFAHPAFDAGLPALVEAARANGVAMLGIRRSYTIGVLGHPVEDVALRGLVALGFTNSPPNIAPWGGRKKLFGTNPLAFASPRADGPPLVFDMASSVVAKVTMVNAAQRGAVPAGWALDAEGKPTTDPTAALEGSMAPLGGAKGAALALLVDLLAGGLAGANFSRDAVPFAAPDPTPAGVGQLIVAFDPDAFAPGFVARVESLAATILADRGARLPGDRRLVARAEAERDGVAVDEAVLARIAA